MHKVIYKNSVYRLLLESIHVLDVYRAFEAIRTKQDREIVVHILNNPLLDSIYLKKFIDLSVPPTDFKTEFDLKRFIGVSEPAIDTAWQTSNRFTTCLELGCVKWLGETLPKVIYDDEMKELWEKEYGLDSAEILFNKGFSNVPISAEILNCVEYYKQVGRLEDWNRKNLMVKSIAKEGPYPYIILGWFIYSDSNFRDSELPAKRILDSRPAFKSKYATEAFKNGTWLLEVLFQLAATYTLYRHCDTYIQAISDSERYGNISLESIIHKKEAAQER